MQAKAAHGIQISWKKKKSLKRMLDKINSLGEIRRLRPCRGQIVLVCSVQLTKANRRGHGVTLVSAVMRFALGIAWPARL